MFTDTNKKRCFKPFRYLLIMAIGTGIGLLFTHPKSGEILQAQAQKLAKKFKKSTEEIKEILDDILKDVSKELEKAYMNAHHEIIGKVNEAAKKTKITRENYEEIVKNILRDMAKNKHWTEEIIDKLKNILQNEWEE